MTVPASERAIRFDDGAAYERGMGAWSQSAGGSFLDWLAPDAGLRWVDVGCGNGAFTETLIGRCRPGEVEAVDPSEQQLAYARARAATRQAVFRQGDAMALPFDDDRFDAAIMALVIFFVPEPSRGVAEMTRVVRPGGSVAAYAWDIPGGGLPFEPIRAELDRIGAPSPLPPRADISREAALRALWTDTGLLAVETHTISVTRRFADFEEFWQGATPLGGLAETLATLPAGDAEQVKRRVRAALGGDAGGPITCSARANAVRGRVA